MTKSALVFLFVFGTTLLAQAGSKAYVKNLEAVDGLNSAELTTLLKTQLKAEGIETVDTESQSQLVISGKAFVLDKKQMFVVKVSGLVAGSKEPQVYGETESAPQGSPVKDVIGKLAKKLAATIKAHFK